MTLPVSWCLPALVLVASVHAVREIPECMKIPSEKMALIKQLVVKEDVHNKLVGEFDELWLSSKHLTNSCVKQIRTKQSDTVLTLRVIAKQGERYHTRNSTLVKVANGTYLQFKEKESEPNAKILILYADDKAIAYHACGVKPDPRITEELASMTRVSVRVKEGDRRPALEQAAQETVRRVQAHRDVLGEVVLNPHSC